MKRLTVQQTFFISVLFLIPLFAISCGNADSGAGDTQNPSGTTHAQAGGENLQRVTLRITGMS
jgi:hypothetical protein